MAGDIWVCLWLGYDGTGKELGTGELGYLTLGRLEYWYSPREEYYESTKVSSHNVQGGKFSFIPWWSSCGSAIFRIELLLAVRSSPLSCTVSLSCALKDNGSVLSVTSSCCGLSEILTAPLSWSGLMYRTVGSPSTWACRRLRLKFNYIMTTKATTNTNVNIPSITTTAVMLEGIPSFPPARGME